MERLSARQKGPDAFLFPVMDDNLNPVEQHFQVRSFVKFINDRMKRIARRNGIDQKATTIVTRHSRATHLKQAGASTEFIQETLGHMDKRTTENYLDSFEDELKKEFAKKLSIM
jgi:site-specific recombinase XerD